MWKEAHKDRKQQRQTCANYVTEPFIVEILDHSRIAREIGGAACSYLAYSGRRSFVHSATDTRVSLRRRRRHAPQLGVNHVQKRRPEIGPRCRADRHLIPSACSAASPSVPARKRIAEIRIMDSRHRQATQSRGIALPLGAALLGGALGYTVMQHVSGSDQGPSGETLQQVTEVLQQAASSVGQSITASLSAAVQAFNPTTATAPIKKTKKKSKKKRGPKQAVAPASAKPTQSLSESESESEDEQERGKEVAVNEPSNKAVNEPSNKHDLEAEEEQAPEALRGLTKQVPELAAVVAAMPDKTDTSTNCTSSRMRRKRDFFNAEPASENNKKIRAALQK